MEKPCEHCGRPILGMPAQLARRKFCSQVCAGASRKGKRKTEWVTIACQQCGTTFEVTPAWERNGRRRYCSRQCHAKANNLRKARLGKRHTPESRAKMSAGQRGRQVREKSSQWKGGTFLDQSGYRHVMIELLPEPAQTYARAMRQRSKYILEHRAVAAAKVGRPLTPQEVVHHHDGHKANNDPANLFVVERGAHSLAHRNLERELLAAKARIVELEAELVALRSVKT